MDDVTRGHERAGEPSAGANETDRPAPPEKIRSIRRAHEDAPAPAEPRQRWRLRFSRRSVGSGRTHREIAEDWLEGLSRVALPLPWTTGRPKPPLAFAAPLPVGMPANCEIADLLLAQRLPAWAVREAVASSMPPELRLGDVMDVWLGAAPLAASVRAADYRVALGDGAPDRAALVRAAHDLLAARSLERTRQRGERSVRYDLRPLVGDITVVDSVPPLLRIRTMFHVERGAGRPEEVVAALGDALGRRIHPLSIVRERIVVED